MKPSQVPEGSDEIRALYVWLDERLVQLANSHTEAHMRLRSDMNSGFSGVNARLDGVASNVGAHDRQIGIRTDRSDRSERQGGILGAITGGLAAGAVLAIKSLFNK